MSTLAELESRQTARDVKRVKFLSASGKRPFFKSCDVMEFAVIGRLEYRMFSQLTC